VKITVNGFKGLTGTFDLESRVLVHGEHSSGKTSLLNAMHFVLYGGVPRTDGSVVRSGAKLEKYADAGAWVCLEADGLTATRSLVAKTKTVGQHLVVVEGGETLEGDAAEARLAKFTDPLIFADFSTFLSKTGEDRKKAMVELLGLSESKETRVWMASEFLRRMLKEITPGAAGTTSSKKKRDKEEVVSLYEAVTKRLTEKEIPVVREALKVVGDIDTAGAAVAATKERKNKAAQEMKSVAAVLKGLSEVSDEDETALAARVPELEERQKSLLTSTATMERTQRDVDGAKKRRDQAGDDVKRLMGELVTFDVPEEEALRAAITKATEAVDAIKTQRPQEPKAADTSAIVADIAGAKANLDALKDWAMERIALVEEARTGTAKCPTCFAPITLKLAKSLADEIRGKEPARDALKQAIAMKQRELDLAKGAGAQYDNDLKRWRQRERDTLDALADANLNLSQRPKRAAEHARMKADLATAHGILDESPKGAFDPDGLTAAKGQLERIEVDLKKAREAQARLELMQRTDARKAEFDALVWKYAHEGARDGRNAWLQSKIDPVAGKVAVDLKALGMAGELHINLGARALELGWKRDEDGRIIDVETLGGAEAARFAAALLANLGDGLITLRGEAMNPATLQRMAKWFVKKDFKQVIVDTHYKPRGGFEGWQLLDMSSIESNTEDDGDGDTGGEEPEAIEPATSTTKKPPALSLV